MSIRQVKETPTYYLHRDTRQGRQARGKLLLSRVYFPPEALAS